jgi:hypothetical protein
MPNRGSAAARAAAEIGSESAKGASWAKIRLLFVSKK